MMSVVLKFEHMSHCVMRHVLCCFVLCYSMFSISFYGQLFEQIDDFYFLLLHVLCHRERTKVAVIRVDRGQTQIAANRITPMSR